MNYHEEKETHDHPDFKEGNRGRKLIFKEFLSKLKAVK